MTLWEDAREANSRHEYALTILDHVVSLRREQPRFPEFRGRGPFNIATPRDNVLGYGLWVEVRDGPAIPALFVEQRGRGREPVPIAETKFGVELARAVGDSVPGLLVELPRPRLHAVGVQPIEVAPNTAVFVGAERSTFGVPVTTADGERALTTAGHGARVTGAAAQDQMRRRVGVVGKTVDPQLVPRGFTTADAAVIRLDADCPERHPAAMAIGVARESDEVALTLDRGTAATWVRGLSPSYALTRDRGAWGEVAITAECISREGDSGACVTGADGAVVGFVVAGQRNAFSVIEDAEYVLRTLDVTIRQEMSS